MNQKQLWDKLAKSNSKYYIASFKGKTITEYNFKLSGREDYKKYFILDKMIRPHGVCLELGCGNGRMTEFISEGFNKVIGTDISGEMIRQGRDRLEHLGNVELIETNGLILPLPDNSVDFAFSYIVFQHFKTREMLESNFEEVYRVLKKGGMFKVLVRADKVNVNLTWWGGVACDESLPISKGFKLLKKEKVKSYGLWLWLQK